MANQTTEFKRTVSGTINSGMRSVFGGEGRRYFIIEHKDDSALHRRGEQQKMIVDEVFIGRDKKCQVLIDEQFGTVSREHAVIVRDGDRWKLIHRSSTNDTFVNGQRVMGEQYLQNGDEIQLSYNGPRLGFIIPQGDQSFVKSIGMTARLNLFRQQALRPYKTALTLLTILFCLAVAGLVTGLVLANKETKKTQDELVQVKNDAAEAQKLANEQIADLKDRIARVGRGGGGGGKVVNTHGSGQSVVGFTGELKPFESYVYFVKMTKLIFSAEEGTDAYEIIGDRWEYHFKESEIPIATGFVTSDGYFYTARHVVEPWAYWANIESLNPFTLANILFQMGATIDATIEAENNIGDKRVMNYSDFNVVRKNDVTVDIGDGYSIYLANGSDYAYKRININSNIQPSPQLSKSIPAGTRLEVLGFPNGRGGDKNDIRPQYTYATTSNDGLLHNVIPVTGANFEPGNSGGPVFSKEGNNYYVVGLVSTTHGRSSGSIVPFSNIGH